MAKINPLLGKGTGKVGAFLLQVNSGVQILKEKPVKVANPNTDAQAEQRAKLKLMSQLAADLSQTIGFQKKGLVSARNQFISANIGKCTFTNNVAKVNVASLDLTGGSVKIPAPAFSGENGVQLAAAAPASVNAVLYAVYEVGADNQLQLVGQKIVSVAGEGNLFPATIEHESGFFVIYAYGILNNGNASMISYEDYIANLNDDDAVLSYVRSIVVRGGTLSATSGTIEEIR